MHADKTQTTSFSLLFSREDK